MKNAPNSPACPPPSSTNSTAAALGLLTIAAAVAGSSTASAQFPGSQGITLGLNGVAYLNTNVSTDVTAQDRFYTVNLTTGVANGGALIGTSSTFNTADIAAFVVPEPGTWAMLVLGGVVLLVVAGRRRASVAR